MSPYGLLSFNHYLPLKLLFVFPVLVVIQKKANAQSKPWPVPPQASSLKNPVTPNVTSLKEGKAMYASYCAPCHGDKGKGDGAAAAALTPKPADHSSAVMLNETDGSIYYKISEGRIPMPPFKLSLNDNQRWELVSYIRTLYKGNKK